MVCSMPSPSAMPLVMVVLPAPRSPLKARMPPEGAPAPIRLPMARVLLTVLLVSMITEIIPLSEGLHENTPS